MERAAAAPRGRGPARDWTKGNIINNLLSLSWPMMAGMSFEMLGPTIDMFWVGKLGGAAIAGVGISGTIVMFVNSMMMGLYMGLRAMVARFIGAGDSEQANHVAQQAVVVNIIYSVIMAAVGVFFSRQILVLFGLSPDVVDAGTPYLRIQFIGMVTMSTRRMSEAMMQASGDSMTPMWISACYRVLHLALVPFLVFGWWIFPEMGVTGAAVTGVVAQGLGAVIGMWLLMRGSTRLQLNFRNFHFDPGMTWRLMKVSTWAAITANGRNLGNLLMTWLITPFGTAAVAAHALNQRLEMFISTPAWGMGQGAGVLAGQNLGAGQPKRAEKTGWLAGAFLTGIMLLVSLALALWAQQISAIFTSDPQIVETSALFLRISAVGYLMMGLTVALQQCVSGAGDTFMPMIIMMLNIWLIQLPTAFFLAHSMHFDVLGVRWAIVIGATTTMVSYIIYYRMGKWQKKKF